MRSIGAICRLVHRPDYFLDLLLAHHARSQQYRVPRRRAKARWILCRRGAAAVQHHGHAIAQRVTDMLRRASAKVRRIDWRSAPRQARLPPLISARAMGLSGIRTPTVSNPAVNRSGTCGRFGKTSVSGPGQKTPRQPLGSLRPFPHQPARHLDRIHMDDQRARRRPAFRSVDLFYRRGIERVSAQSINRLGRKRDQLAGTNQLGRAAELRFADLLNQAGPLFRRPRPCRCACIPGRRA